jgi:Skp family chaperone for outer membrane proteins
MIFHFAHHPRAWFCLSRIMQTMRESWTDERLDDGFDRVSADIQSLREESKGLRKEMRQEFGSMRQEMNARFEHQEGRFDDLQRILIQVGSGMIVALLGILATQL